MERIEREVVPADAPSIGDLEQASDRERAERLCKYYRLPLTPKNLKAFSGFDFENREPDPVHEEWAEEADYPIKSKKRILAVMPALPKEMTDGK